MLTVAVGLLRVSNWWFRQSKQPVLIGDTKSAVLSKLGKPVAMFTNDFVSLKYGGEVWAFGREFDPKAAVQGEFPFKWRFFAPDESDVLVVFDSSGQVKQLQSPKK